ncbi:hypothetical protein C8Q79DRAFT_913190 [Trametes meyenii]|nr:hypothetical protein C8Q79DRAFT_913190 [Trametes meyenii]
MRAKLSETHPLPGLNVLEFAPIYLPRPMGRFPAVHQASPTALTSGLDPIQLRDWLSQPTSTSAAIQISGIDYPTHEEATLVVNRLQSALIDLTGCKAIEVAAPIAARRSDSDLAHPLPSVFLAHNMSESATKRLKKQSSWSLKTIAFFVYDLRPLIPEFLFPLYGFTNQGVRELETIIKQTLSQPDYRNFTLSLALDNPEFLGQRPDDIFDSLMRSIRVKVVEFVPLGTPIVNVYGKSPTTSPQLWCLWRDVLGDAEYRSSFARVGCRRLGYTSCARCHGADHVLTGCPYGRVLGWYGMRL